MTFNTTVDGTLTERMRIASSGNIGIGTTATGSYTLDVGGGTSGYNIRGYDVYTHDGAVTSFSDQNLKNINGSFNRGLAEIMDINPIYFYYKNGNPLNLDGSERNVGVIAQDIQKIIPEAVKVGEDGYLTLSTGPIFYTMINAIKEQQSDINGISTEVSGLTDNQNKIVEQLTD